MVALPKQLYLYTGRCNLLLLSVSKLFLTCYSFSNTRFQKVYHLGYRPSFSKLRRSALTNVTYTKTRSYSQSDLLSGRKCYMESKQRVLISACIKVRYCHPPNDNGGTEDMYPIWYGIRKVILSRNEVCDDYTIYAQYPQTKPIGRNFCRQVTSF
jgi:hypothetical protein